MPWTANNLLALLAQINVGIPLADQQARDVISETLRLLNEVERLKKLPHIIHAESQREAGERFFTWLCGECCDPPALIHDIGGKPDRCEGCNRTADRIAPLTPKDLLAELLRRVPRGDATYE